jgi:microcystin-dependent protein
MGTPYIGEIRMFGSNFPPVGWAFCNGQLMPISENEALFQLIGTTYGGDGQANFALPDLQCRIPLHTGTNPGTGTNYPLAEVAGVENVTLTTPQIPVHNHTLVAATSVGSTTAPAGNFVAAPNGVNMYFPFAATAAMNAASIGSNLGGQPHDNMMPFLAVSFIISLFGLFPPQT